jgi:hypothetical protein
MSCAPPSKTGGPGGALEFAGIGALVAATMIPRSARVQLAWQY